MEINPEDLTLEQVKEQLAIYSRLYYTIKKENRIRTLWKRKGQTQ